MPKLISSISFVALSAILLTGCVGGGSGDSSSNTTPTIPSAPTLRPVTPISKSVPVAPVPAPTPVPTSAPTQGTYAPAVTDSGAKYWRDRGYDGTGVTIAYLDGGVSDASAVNHLTLQANQEYAYDANSNLYVKDASVSLYNYDHGQKMIETGSGKVNGLAPGASIISGVISDSSGRSLTQNILMGTQWAIAHGANIVNFSFEYGGFSAPDTGTTQTQVSKQAQNTFANIISSNVLVVSSAGNSTASVSSLIATPLNPGWVDITHSNAKGNIIIAGALDPNTGGRASYSNYAGSDALVQHRFLLAPGYGKLADGSTVYGTSPAASNVSAAAALMMQKWANLGGVQASNILLGTANHNYAGYNAALDGVGKMDLVAAFSPIGVTGVSVSTVDNKMSLQQASISVPLGLNVQKSATFNILDSYNRTFAVPVSSLVHQEQENRFLNITDAFMGQNYQVRQNDLEVSAINGQTDSKQNIGGVDLLTGTGNKFSISSNEIPYLNDKSMFDGIASLNRNYFGLDFKNGFLTKAILSGNEYTGYATGSSLEYASSNGFYVKTGVSTGKLTNTLSGRIVDVEAGIKTDNGFMLKTYSSQSNYLNNGLFNDFQTMKTGALISQTLSITSTDKVGVMLKTEATNGSTMMKVADSVNPDNTINFSNQSVGLTQFRQEVGLTYQGEHVTLMGVVGNVDSGVVFSYKSLI
jgi:hypothetical protein